MSIPIDDIAPLIDHWRNNLPIPCSRAEAVRYMVLFALQFERVREMAKRPEECHS